MKKFLALISTFAIIACCLISGIGTIAFAAEESPSEDFLVYDGILEEYIGEGGDIVIPASLGITEIASNAFYQNSDITSVVIPEGVVKLGSAAFGHCENLEQITLPYSLCEMDEHVFSGAAITEITIPGNCQVVNYGCFSGCTYLSDITLSYGVVEIQILAFQGTAATKVVFPKTVDLICGSAFIHNKAAGATKIEYTICNPDCEIGFTADNYDRASKHNWNDERSTPWNHNPGNATINIIVPEDSEIEAWCKANMKQILNKFDSDDGLRIVSQEKAYFEELEENQKGYGTQKPTSTGTSEDGDGLSGGGAGTTSNNKPSNSNKVSGNTNGTVTVEGNNSSNTVIVIILCIFGGLMLAAIVTVIILAATGKLFGNKSKNSEMPDAEMMAKFMAMMKEQENKNSNFEELNEEITEKADLNEESEASDENA